MMRICDILHCDPLSSRRDSPHRDPRQRDRHDPHRDDADRMDQYGPHRAAAKSSSSNKSITSLRRRAIGASPARILFRHLIPNAMGPIIAAMTLTVPTAIFTEAFLSFLGLGIQAPAASWGVMVNDGLSAMRYYPWRLLFLRDDHTDDALVQSARQRPSRCT